MRGWDPSWFPHPFVNVSWTDRSLKRNIECPCFLITKSLQNIKSSHIFRWLYFSFVFKIKIFMVPVKLFPTERKTLTYRETITYLSTNGKNWKYWQSPHHSLLLQAIARCPHIFSFLDQRFHFFLLFLIFFLFSCGQSDPF